MSCSVDCADGCNLMRRETLLAASRPIRCEACRRPIPVNVQYVKAEWFYEGEIHGAIRCGACQATYQHLRDLGWKVDKYPDERLDCGLDYASEWDKGPPPEIDRLPLLTDQEAGALLSTLQIGGEDYDERETLHLWCPTCNDVAAEWVEGDPCPNTNALECGCPGVVRDGTVLVDEDFCDPDHEDGER